MLFYVHISQQKVVSGESRWKAKSKNSIKNHCFKMKDDEKPEKCTALKRCSMTPMWGDEE